MSRAVQVGDLVRITLGNEIQTHPIELIDGDRIYIATGEGFSSLLIPLNGEYQVEGLGVNHRVEFISNDSPVMTGLSELDLMILEELDDTDLETVCRVNGYTESLCQGDQLWKDKIIGGYGQVTLNQKSPDLTFRKYYDYLKSFLSVAGANLALVRNDQPLLDLIMADGYQPDIHLADFQPNIGAYYFTQDVMNFLQEVELGPQVMGAFPNGSIDQTTVKALENTRLNDILWFLEPRISGRPNPLYRIVLRSTVFLHDIFIVLLLHHLHVSRALKGAVFSATDDMRKYLGNIIQNIIDNDVRRIQQRSSSVAQLAREKGNLAKRAIDEPTLKINTSVTIGRAIYSIFNPNEFTQGDLGKFREHIYEPDEVYLTPQNLVEISEVYSIIPNTSPDIIINVINAIEHRVIALAQEYRKMNVKLSWQ